MTYRVYQTEGIILFKKDLGEADRLYYIFTEKFGMIKAMAQGVRYIKSKLRPSLDLFSYDKFSLIYGRENWRIIDTIIIKNNIGLLRNKNGLNSFARFANFLLKMAGGEERNDFIWQEVKNFFLKNNLPTDQNTSYEEMRSYGRILKELGYLSNIPNTKRELLVEINRAIKESML